MRELEKHVYFYDTVVIGGNLPAFLYAYTNNLPIVFVDAKPPFEFDEVDNLDFEGLGLHTHTTKIASTRTLWRKEKRHLRLWERIGFLLGVAGLMPVSSLCREHKNTGQSAKNSDRKTENNKNKF